MITISIAQFFINLTGKKAHQGGELAAPALKSPKHRSLWLRMAGLLPPGVQKRAALRKIARLERQSLARLAETSAHLLADIGVVPTALATFDGATPKHRNASLIALQWPAPGMRFSAPMATA